MILFTTLVLNTYIALLSFQVNGIMPSNSIRIVLFGFMVIEGIVMLFIRIRSKKKHKIIHLPAFIVCALIFLIYILCYLPVAQLDLSRTMQILFFPICLVVTYVNFICIKDEKTFDQIVDIQFYYLIVVAAAFFVAQILHRGEYRTNINTVYYTIFALPFILYQKNATKKWVGLAIILACLFLSLKRTSLIAIFLALVSYTNTRDTIKKTASRIILVLVSIFALDALFSFFGDIHLLGRLSTLTEDGGSGRGELMAEALKLLRDCSFGKFFLGHSLTSTASAFSRGAHNDFLEVAYRAGIVGLIVYLGYYVGIISVITCCIRAGNHKEANLLKATFMLFLVVSCFSQLIFLPTYVGLIALSISFATARNRFYEQHQQPELIQP